MAVVCHFLPFASSSPPLQLQTQLQSVKTHLLKLSLNKSQPSKFPRKVAKLRSKSNDKVEGVYMDENGVVDDMEGYLNTLSLEYDSVWDTKPSWCQPWTIVMTGASVIACSWLILHSVIVTLLASSLICAWWYIFLYSYPKSYSQMIAERRKRVRSGMEDTYGSTKNQ